MPPLPLPARGGPSGHFHGEDLSGAQAGPRLIFLACRSWVKWLTDDQGETMQMLKRPLLAAGIAAGTFGLTFGLGMAVASAATSSSGNTSSTSSGSSSSGSSGSSSSSGCPGMGASSGSTSTSGFFQSD